MRFSDVTSGKREAPPPLEGNVVAVVATGTAVWAVLFVAQLPFYSWYADHGHEWFIWSCLAGAGLGVYGLWFSRRRENAIRAAREREQQAERPGS